MKAGIEEEGTRRRGERGSAGKYSRAAVKSPWKQVTLGDVCGIPSKLVDPRLPVFQDLLHVGAGNMETGNGELKGLLTAREEGLISSKFLFDEKAVLYSKIRPYLMKVARPDFAGLCSADVYPLEPSLERINRDFLYHLLLTPGFTDYAVEGSARAGMPKVNREHLFAFAFRLPPLLEQQRIVAILRLERLVPQVLELRRQYLAIQRHIVDDQNF